MTTIANLKNSLNSGTRTNKYLLELPIEGGDSATLNILCKSAGFPERTMNITTIFHKGRKYTARGETDYGGTYEITIIDDSSMTYRKLFDEWMKRIDDSKPASAGISGGSFEKAVGGVLKEINAGVKAIKMVKNVIQNPKSLVGMALNFLEGGGTNVKYQIDLNIWQLSTTGKKVYGYKLQNAFPTTIGSVTFDDEAQNTLTEYTVTFSFSEFEPLEDKSTFERIAGVIVGENTVKTFKNVQSLFK